MSERSCASLLLRRFVFRMAEASAKRVTGDEPQGTMGRVQTAGEAPARSCVVFLAKKSFSWHGPIFGLFKSWKRSILVAYCCKHCKLWVDRWMAQNFKTWGRNNRQAAKESVLLDSYESKTSNKIFDDLTVSGKSYILVFNLSFIAESGLVKYSAGDYVSIFRSFRPNPPNNEQVTLWIERSARPS